MPFRFCSPSRTFANIVGMRPYSSFLLALLCCSSLFVPARAQNLENQPLKHHFGDIQVGNSASFSFKLTNHGTTALRLTEVSLKDTVFSVGDFALPIKIEPGESVELPVTFTPQTEGRVESVAEISSNDPDSPLRIHVYGAGEAETETTKKLTVSPSTLAFGNVTVGDSAALQATLTASGGPVTITADRTNSSEFTISGLALPAKIRSGHSVQATITFTPNASGTAEAKAGFTSNAEDSPSIAHLNGTGVAQGSHSAYLTWDTGAQNIVGYNVYRGTTHGGPYSQINTSMLASTNYTDSNVADGTTYYYVATEVNGEGQESDYSNEAKAKIPKD